ncbi:MAG: antibiotic biosynthesis monooxygenase [Flavobacteriales bacterium]|nr:MAG: antibiotic biosynthesis monooxygenase [Flavobacteriales bacterium]
MIIRIVKMTFLPERVDDFLEVFGNFKEKIRAFEGCSKVELLQDVRQPHVFFTYSWWDSETHLNNYRHSELFQSTWAKTKQLFSDKAEAWSLESKVEL